MEAKTFADLSFWNSRYASDEPKFFDWYDEWALLRKSVGQYITGVGTALVIGCGNSKMTESLLDDGYLKVTGVDFSDVVINKMIEHYKYEERLSFEVKDVTNMDFSEGSFDAVFDKGCIDALTTGKDADTAVKNALLGAAKVIKDGGYLISISFAPDVLRSRYFEMVSDKLRLVESIKIPKPVVGGFFSAFILRKN